MNLSNLSTSKKSTRADYLTSKDTQKSVGNTKKGIKASKSSNYLTLNTKKDFNLLAHTFIQALILKDFDPE